MLKENWHTNGWHYNKECRITLFRYCRSEVCVMCFCLWFYIDNDSKQILPAVDCWGVKWHEELAITAKPPRSKHTKLVWPTCFLATQVFVLVWGIKSDFAIIACPWEESILGKNKVRTLAASLSPSEGCTDAFVPKTQPALNWVRNKRIFSLAKISDCCTLLIHYTTNILRTKHGSNNCDYKIALNADAGTTAVTMGQPVQFLIAHIVPRN